MAVQANNNTLANIKHQRLIAYPERDELSLRYRRLLKEISAITEEETVIVNANEIAPLTEPGDADTEKMPAVRKDQPMRPMRTEPHTEPIVFPARSLGDNEDSMKTRKIVKVWRRSNGSMPVEEVTWFHGVVNDEDRWLIDCPACGQRNDAEPS